MKRSIALALVFVALFGCATRTRTNSDLPSFTLSPRTDDPRAPRAPRDAMRAHVVHVTDGDTIVLSGIDVGEVHRETGGHKSRLIGIDTPEIHGQTECYGRQASAFTERELGGKDVLVDFDIDRLDRYGRALVYVWQTDGRFFNGRLAQEGYAYQVTFPPNVRYVVLFSAMVREARNGNRGLWRGCEPD